MKALLLILVCAFVFFFSWPLAIGLFIIGMVGWLILLPFKIIGFTIAILFKLIIAIIAIPLILLMFLFCF